MKEVDEFAKTWRMLAPGTPLREGLDNILRAKTGGLIVVSDSPQVMEIVEGGFIIDTEFTPAALYELGKMDGAIILNSDVTRILRANAHLVPQANIASQETGIRHRVADRVARQTGALVIAISQRRSIITLYQGSHKFVVRETPFILSKANQAIQTLDKYKYVLDKSLNKLSILEFEDIVTVHDVAKVVQRLEMVLRVVREIKHYIYQLGTEGRLINLQLEELTEGTWEANDLLLKDYYVGEGEKSIEEISSTLQQYACEEKLDMVSISRLLGYGGALSSLDLPVTPRGYRMLNKLPRLPLQVIDNLVERFGVLPKIIQASVQELDEVEGIGEVRAKTIKEGLQKLREQLLLDPHI
ncbi:MAG: diadenylate cyclase [Clostridia bacterium]|jgi:diadenylate cyclase|nr:integrity scanning, DisA, linker region [Clostridiales bacterium]MDK2986696.1 diadenylate cyclase [Clostridia bacterium]